MARPCQAIVGIASRVMPGSDGQHPILADRRLTIDLPKFGHPTSRLQWSVFRLPDGVWLSSAYA
jgi:hypothetical protein